MDVPPRTAARAAFVCAGLHALACVAMLVVLEPGLPVEGSTLEARAAWLRAAPWRWSAGWIVWQAAALSLLAFYAALDARWRARAPLLCVTAVLAATAAFAADAAAEAIAIVVAPRLGTEGLAVAEDVLGALSGFLGNGLYTIAGALLTVAGAGELPRGLVALAVPVWLAGAGLSAAVLARSPSGQLACTAVLFPLFIAWTAAVGLWLRRRGS